MNFRKVKIGFIGSGDWGAVFFDSLSKNSLVNIKSIITLRHNNNKIFAKTSKADVLLYKNKKDYNLLNEGNLDAIFMAGWPLKIPTEILQARNCCIYNIHASLLPKYRGPEPIIQQLLHSESEGGVTIHKVSSEWDAGEICEQKSFNIINNDNNSTLFFKASRAGIKLLNILINKIICNQVEYKMQNEGASTYYRKINIMDYIIDKNSSIQDITTYYKAFYGIYPLIYRLNGKLIMINRYDIVKSIDKDNFYVPIKDGFLRIMNFKYLELS